MPHRTVFQLGKNHAHPFTMFIGGFVLGVLVTGAVAWAWVIADETQVDEGTVVTKKAQSKASPSPSVRPVASPAVSF